MKSTKNIVVELHDKKRVRARGRNDYFIPKEISVLSQTWLSEKNDSVIISVRSSRTGKRPPIVLNLNYNDMVRMYKAIDLALSFIEKRRKKRLWSLFWSRKGKNRD